MNIPFKKSPIALNAALLSPSNIFDLLPDDHECFVYRDLFDQLDTTAIEKLYSDKGQHAYHPKLIVSILIYAYSRGTFSSREIERRCKEDLSFMFIAQMGCPNFRVLSDFRKDHLEFFHDCFKQTVKLALELKLASLGHISLDGSKFEADSSKHKAMSYQHLKAKEQQLTQEIEALVAQAKRCDKEEDQAALSLSDEVARNAALYFPRVLEADPLRDGHIDTFAPCGIVAGIMARTDTSRGVWKAPAGLDASMNGIQGVNVNLNDAENGMLNPLGINCLRAFPANGRVIWGARTLRGADQLADEWKYIPVRRTALFIEESLYRGTQWVVFEPNDEPLWAQIRLNIGAFMHNLFRQGAFQGTTPRDAYFVKCDKETTNQTEINSGIVNIVVGFAPLKPAEFVVIFLLHCRRFNGILFVPMRFLFFSADIINMNVNALLGFFIDFIIDEGLTHCFNVFSRQTFPDHFFAYGIECGLQ